LRWFNVCDRKFSTHKSKSTNGEFLSVGTQKLFWAAAEECDQFCAEAFANLLRAKTKNVKEKLKITNAKGKANESFIFPFAFVIFNF